MTFLSKDTPLSERKKASRSSSTNDINHLKRQTTTSTFQSNHLIEPLTFLLALPANPSLSLCSCPFQTCHLTTVKKLTSLTHSHLFLPSRSSPSSALAPLLCALLSCSQANEIVRALKIFSSCWGGQSPRPRRFW